MYRKIAIATVLVSSIAVIGNVSAQAPNFQPKANINLDVVQNQIQALQKEVGELKKMNAEQSKLIDALTKSGARSLQVIAELQQQHLALKKAFNEHTHIIPVGEQSPVGLTDSSNLVVTGAPAPGAIKSKKGTGVPFLTLVNPALPWASGKSRLQVQ